MKVKQTDMLGFLTPKQKQKAKAKPKKAKASKGGVTKKPTRKSKRNAEEALDSEQNFEAVVSQKTTSTVIEINETQNSETVLNDDRAIPELERSLDELIVNALITQQPQGTSSPNPSNSELNSNIVQSLKVEVLNTKSLLDSVTAEKVSAQRQVQLLEEELSEVKKVQVNLQKENKKLTTANDNLRRGLSKYEGMRRFASQTTDYCDKEQQTVPNTESADVLVLKEHIEVANAKIDSLADQIKSVGDSLTSILTDDSNTFQVVENRRSNRTKRRSHTSSNESVVEVDTSTVHNTSQNQSKTNQGHAIPVITAGKLSAVHRKTPSYSDVAAGRAKSTEKVMVIGTSITKGSGYVLNEKGIDATTYSYPGAKIPLIRDRLQHITKNNNPDTIVIQAGGNDCQSTPLDKVQSEYACLVNDVKYQWPEAKVILSQIPPRKTDVKTKLKIAGLNEKIKSMSDASLNIHFMDFSPKLDIYYQKDKLHFNEKGVDYYCTQMSQFLSNFRLSQPKPSST